MITNGITKRGVFIDLKTDFGFKHCMGDEPTMRSFLNAILSEDYGRIDHLEFLPEVQTRDHPDLRGVTFDLRCRLDNGDDVIVEMQNYAHPFFKTRANYYLYNLMDKHITKGTAWSEIQEDIPRLIGVFILGVPMEGLDEVVTRTAEFDIDKGTEFWDRMRKYYISLPNFQLSVRENGLTTKDIWFETIKNLGNMERIDPAIYELADDALLELIEKAKVSALSEEEYAQYEAELKILSNRGTVERYGFDMGRKEGFKQGREEGWNEGLNEGKIEGRKEGLKEGRKEGKIEGKIEGRKEGSHLHALQMARLMISHNEPFDKIMLYTGLSKEEIDAL